MHKTIVWTTSRQNKNNIFSFGKYIIFFLHPQSNTKGTLLFMDSIYLLHLIPHFLSYPQWHRVSTLHFLQLWAASLPILLFCLSHPLLSYLHSVLSSQLTFLGRLSFVSALSCISIILSHQHLYHTVLKSLCLSHHKLYHVRNTLYLLLF